MRKYQARRPSSGQILGRVALSAVNGGGPSVPVPPPDDVFLVMGGSNSVQEFNVNTGNRTP